MEVKLKSFRATMTDCLWQFMQNTSQPWNHNVTAFLCTGRVEVVKGGICAVNAPLQKP